MNTRLALIIGATGTLGKALPNVPVAPIINASRVFIWSDLIYHLAMLIDLLEHHHLYQLNW